MFLLCFYRDHACIKQSVSKWTNQTCACVDVVILGENMKTLDPKLVDMLEEM